LYAFAAVPQMMRDRSQEDDDKKDDRSLSDHALTIGGMVA
jgi:hypothetical protein